VSLPPEAVFRACCHAMPFHSTAPRPGTGGSAASACHRQPSKGDSPHEGESRRLVPRTSSAWKGRAASPSASPPSTSSVSRRAWSCLTPLCSARRWLVSKISTPKRLPPAVRSEEHTSELQSRENLVCRLLLEKKKRFSDKSSQVFF